MPTSIQTDAPQCFSFWFYNKKKPFSCKIWFSVIWRMLQNPHNQKRSLSHQTLFIDIKGAVFSHRHSLAERENAWWVIAILHAVSTGDHFTSWWWLGQWKERKKRTEGSLSSLAFHPTKTWSHQCHVKPICLSFFLLKKTKSISSLLHTSGGFPCSQASPHSPKTCMWDELGILDFTKVGVWVWMVLCVYVAL